jgi:hypothetical protein
MGNESNGSNRSSRSKRFSRWESTFSVLNRNPRVQMNRNQLSLEA